MADWGFIVLNQFSPDFIPLEETMDYKTHEELIREGEDPIGWFFEGRLFTTAGYPHFDTPLTDDTYAMYQDIAPCTGATNYLLEFDFDFSFGKGLCQPRQSGSPVWYGNEVVGILIKASCIATKMRDYMIDIMQSFKKEEGIYE